MTQRKRRPLPPVLIVIDDADHPAPNEARARDLATANRLEPTVAHIPTGPSSERQAALGRLRRAIPKQPHAIIPTLETLGRDVGQVSIALDEALHANTTVHVLTPRMTLAPRRAPALLGVLAQIERKRRTAGAAKSHATAAARNQKPGRPGYQWTPELIEKLHQLVHDGNSIRDIVNGKLIRVPHGDKTPVPSRTAIQRALAENPAPA